MPLTSPIIILRFWNVHFQITCKCVGVCLVLLTLRQRQVRNLVWKILRLCVAPLRWQGALYRIVHLVFPRISQKMGMVIFLPTLFPLILRLIRFWARTRILLTKDLHIWWRRIITHCCQLHNFARL